MSKEIIVEVQGHKVDIQKALDLIMEKLPMELELRTAEIRNDLYIAITCFPFKKMELGVFQYAVKECHLQTFNSSVTESNSTKSGEWEWFWWSTWNLTYPGNSMEVCSIVHNITQNTWEIELNK